MITDVAITDVVMCRAVFLRFDFGGYQMLMRLVAVIFMLIISDLTCVAGLLPACVRVMPGASEHRMQKHC